MKLECIHINREYIVFDQFLFSCLVALLSQVNVKCLVEILLFLIWIWMKSFFILFYNNKKKRIVLLNLFACSFKDTYDTFLPHPTDQFYFLIIYTHFITSQIQTSNDWNSYNFLFLFVGLDGAFAIVCCCMPIINNTLLLAVFRISLFCFSSLVHLRHE